MDTYTIIVNKTKCIGRKPWPWEDIVARNREGPLQSWWCRSADGLGGCLGDMLQAPRILTSTYLHQRQAQHAQWAGGVGAGEEGGRGILGNVREGGSPGQSGPSALPPVRHLRPPVLVPSSLAQEASARAEFGEGQLVTFWKVVS